MHRIVLTIIGLVVVFVHISAQDDPQYRMEIGAGVGMVSYEGDFNGNIFAQMQPFGTVVGRYNIDAYKALKMGVSFGKLLWRYNFDPYKDLRLSASYGKLKGSSADVKTYYPDYAESTYEFNHNVVDVSLVFGYNFWPYGTGRDYRGAKRLTPYIYGGLGATSVSGGSKSVFTANVPIGIGVKYKVRERLNVGLDWGFHFSLNDELDGVKDPYRVKSSGAFKNTDCYSMLQLTITYSFKAKCRTCNKEE